MNLYLIFCLSTSKYLVTTLNQHVSSITRPLNPLARPASRAPTAAVTIQAGITPVRVFLRRPQRPRARAARVSRQEQHKSSVRTLPAFPPWPPDHTETASLAQHSPFQYHVPARSGALTNLGNRFYGLGAVLTIVCGYYFLHSDKSPGSGQAAIKEIRRSDDTASPQNEYRDPRDSGVKTPQQKREKEEGKLR